MKTQLVNVAYKLPDGKFSLMDVIFCRVLYNVTDCALAQRILGLILTAPYKNQVLVWNAVCRYFILNPILDGVVRSYKWGSSLKVRCVIAQLVSLYEVIILFYFYYVHIVHHPLRHLCLCLFPYHQLECRLRFHVF